MRGHTKEMCYRLNGYPAGYRNNRRNSMQQQTWHINMNNYNNSTANNIVVESVSAGNTDGVESQETQMSLNVTK